MSPSDLSRALPHRILNISLVGLLLAGASCGGGGSKADSGPPAGDGGGVDRNLTDRGPGGGDTSVGGTPAMQCLALTAVICDRLAECEMATPADVASCNKLLAVQFGCDRATADFGACINDTKALTCAQLFTANGIAPPMSCDTPLNIPLSDAQMKCVTLVNTICQRSNECQGGTATPAQLAMCAEELIFGMDGIPCPIVVGVGPKFDMCIAEIKMLMCRNPDAGVPDAGAADAAPPPSMTPSCNMVLLTPQ